MIGGIFAVAGSQNSATRGGIPLFALAVTAAFAIQVIAFTPAMVMLWAVRLGSFLARRVHKAGSDGRFDEIKGSPTPLLARCGCGRRHAR